MEELNLTIEYDDSYAYEGKSTIGIAVLVSN